MAILFIILFYVLEKGINAISWDFLTEMPKKRGRAGGILPTIVASLELMLLSSAIAAPIGVGTAVYLTEYTTKNKFTSFIRFAIESLAGVPSIIFGLFGFAFFVLYLDLGWSILSGSLTLAIMILPILIRTTEEALKTVPHGYREGSLALGANLWQTITRIVIPTALPGIITGIILGMGRAIGETAAVMLTAGSALRMPGSLLDSGRSMSLHLYLLASEGVAVDNAYGTAVVLIFFILIINLLTNFVISRLSLKWRG